MIAFIVGLVVYVLGSAFDVYTTKRGVVDNPTRFHEANPIMAPVLERGGMLGLAAVKIVPLVIVGIVGRVADAWTIGGIGLAALGLVFAWAGWHNRRLFHRTK